MSERTFEGTVEEFDQFGGCPLCHTLGRMVYTPDTVWMVCHADRVKWFLEGSWYKGKLPASVLDDNAAFVSAYRDVEPWRPES